MTSEVDKAEAIARAVAARLADEPQTVWVMSKSTPYGPDITVYATEELAQAILRAEVLDEVSHRTRDEIAVVRKALDTDPWQWNDANDYRIEIEAHKVVTHV